MKIFTGLIASTLLLGMAACTPGLSAPAGEGGQAEAELGETTFSIANMTCATCPITVKKAMGAVRGVKSVEIDYQAQTARVVFDTAVTDAATIAAASMDAGYPAVARS